MAAEINVLDPQAAYSTFPGVAVGQRIWIGAYNGVAYNGWFVLVKQLGATAVTAGQLMVANTTDKTTNYGGARLSGTAGAENNIVGHRVVGAASLPQNSWGLVLKKGPLTGVAGTSGAVVAGTDITADGQPVISGTTAGDVQLFTVRTDTTAHAAADALNATAVYAIAGGASSSTFVNLWLTGIGVY